MTYILRTEPIRRVRRLFGLSGLDAKGRMLIFYYVSMAIVALGAVVTAVGFAVGVKYGTLVRHPPDSEEDEERRNRLGITAASLIIIGVLLCGVGILFK
jgi:hypothetical protein